MEKMNTPKNNNICLICPKRMRKRDAKWVLYILLVGN